MGDAEDEARVARIDPTGGDLEWLDEPVPVPRPLREDELPPGPWTWQNVIPQGPVELGFKPATEPGNGVALVASDGTWIVSSEIPEVHPAAKELLAQLPELLEQLRERQLQPGISDIRVLRTIEPPGVRIHLILVADGKASVMRLAIVLDSGQGTEEMERQLDEVAREWTRELRGMTPAEQRQFAELVDETSDPIMVQAQVLRNRPQTPWYNCVIGEPPQEPST